MKNEKRTKTLFHRVVRWRLLPMMVLLLCSFSMSVAAADNGKKVTIVSNGISTKDALARIKQQAKVSIMYEEATLPNVPLNLNINDVPWEQALSVLCSQAGMKYDVVDKNYVILMPIKRGVSRKVISGVLTDSKGDPIIGASVTIKGTPYGTITDVTGRFMLSYPENISSAELMASYVGMQTVSMNIADKKFLNIKMRDDVTGIDEIVVVGYGSSAAKDLTGSVASVGIKQLGQLNTADVSSMLQNLAAGVQVSQTSGVPGETVRVRVRGATSLTGSNEPLYVIDGIPVEDPSMLETISPNDIQTMDVLKDASASAIYGSRAANGVVIITTKKGSTGTKPTVSFNYNYTVDTQIKNFRILYGDEWRDTIRKFARQTLVYDPSNTYANEILEENSTALGTANTNWFDEVKQTAFRNNGDISISGGSKNSKYIVSLSVLNQHGMVKCDKLNRYNARTSLESNVLPSLRFGINATMSYTKQSESGTSLFSSQGFRPDLPVYDEDGNYDMTTGSPNPVANLTKQNLSDIYRIMGTAYGEWDIIRGLTFRTSLSGNLQFTKNTTFSPSFLSRSDIAYGSEYHYRYSKTIFDNTLTFDRELNKNNVVNAVIGVSFESNTARSTTINGNSYPDNDIYINIGSATNLSSWGNGYNSSGLFSSFGRINYKLMDSYLFTFTGRYDGSSMFGKNNRYGFFPSGAIAWRLSNEKFMDEITFVDDLKLRASIGSTGTQNLSSFSNRDLYSATSYNDKSAIVHSKVGNRDIRWEKSTQYDLGLDFSLFNYRLTGSLSAYIKDTKDLIWGYDFPSSVVGGSMSMMRNVGAVRNKGIELNVTGRVLSTSDWNVDLTLNLAHNKNEVTKLVSEGATVTAMEDVIVQGTSNQVLAEGYPMGAFLGYEYNGIIQTQERVDELNAYAKEKGQSYYQ